MTPGSGNLNFMRLSAGFPPNERYLMAARMEKAEWDNIPEWALYALEYGTEEDGGLSEEERSMVERFISGHFPKGYTMSVDWESCNDFDRHPAFGKPCKTCKVIFVSL